MAALTIQEANLVGSLYMPEIISDISDETYILVDDYGNEITAIMSDRPVTLDATSNDIRLGKTAATVEGYTVGEKEIPSYNTSEGASIVLPEQDATIPIRHYDYTKLQVIVCDFNSTIDNSVAANSVSINGQVYPVNSTIATSTVEIDHNNKAISLGIKNETDSLMILRYFTYKEIY